MIEEVVQQMKMEGVLNVAFAAELHQEDQEDQGVSPTLDQPDEEELQGEDDQRR